MRGSTGPHSLQAPTHKRGPTWHRQRRPMWVKPGTLQLVPSGDRKHGTERCREVINSTSNLGPKWDPLGRSQMGPTLDLLFSLKQGWQLWLCGPRGCSLHPGHACYRGWRTVTEGRATDHWLQRQCHPHHPRGEHCHHRHRHRHVRSQRTPPHPAGTHCRTPAPTGSTGCQCCEAQAPLLGAGRRRCTLQAQPLHHQAPPPGRWPRSLRVHRRGLPPRALPLPLRLTVNPYESRDLGMRVNAA